MHKLRQVVDYTVTQKTHYHSRIIMLYLNCTQIQWEKQRSGICWKFKTNSEHRHIETILVSFLFLGMVTVC